MVAVRDGGGSRKSIIKKRSEAEREMLFIEPRPAQPFLFMFDFIFWMERLAEKG